MLTPVSARPSQLGSNMSSSDGSTGAGDLSLRSRTRKASPFLVLAAGLLMFAAVVGAYLLIMRPTTLAHCGRAAGQRRPEPGSGAGAELRPRRKPGSACAGPDRRPGRQHCRAPGPQGRSCGRARRRGNARRHRIRRDPAQERRRAVGVAAQGIAKQGAKSKIKGIDDLAGHRIGVVGRTEVNVHAAARHPEGIRRRSRQGGDRAIQLPTRSPQWCAIPRSTPS